MNHKLSRDAIASSQNPAEMAHALKQIIQGVLIADNGARLLFDITTHELKAEIKQLMLITSRIQRHMIKRCPGSEDIFKRHFNGSEIPMVAELVVLVLGLSDETIENLNKEIKVLVDSCPPD